MGTNYYAKKKIDYPLIFQVNSDHELANLKEHLETLQPEIHLGAAYWHKSFLANYNEGKYYSDYISYINFIKDNDLVIFNDYGRELAKEEFIKVVEDSKSKKRHIDKQYSTYKHFPELDFLDGNWS